MAVQWHRGSRNKSLRPLLPSTPGPRSTLNALKAAESREPCARMRILPDSGGFMMLTRTTQLAAAGALAAAAAFAAPAAQAHGGFSLSIGLPGVVVGAPYYPAPVYAAPAPAPVYVAPPVVYTPPPRVVYYGPRVVYRAPYHYRGGVVIGRPVYYHHH